MGIFDTQYVREEELREEGFKSVGRNVAIAGNCTIVGVENVSIGDDVRIDGYCTIIAANGEITLGSNIHIGSYCLLSGSCGIEFGDFAGLSQGVKIYSRSDDYSGETLTNPTVPAQYTGGASGKVTLGRHVIIGAGSVILPRVTIGDGSSVGALSLVTKSLEPWGIYSGRPARRLKPRSAKLLELEREYLRSKEV